MNIGVYYKPATHYRLYRAPILFFVAFSARHCLILSARYDVKEEKAAAAGLFKGGGTKVLKTFGLD
jgi:hypothetical protein